MKRFLRGQYRAFQWWAKSGPHWWIKPTVITTAEGYRKYVGITFVGPYEADRPASYTHCHFGASLSRSWKLKP